MSFADESGNAEKIGSLGEGDIQPLIGEGCTDGTVLTGWDVKLGRPICAAIEAIEGPPGERGADGAEGAPGADGVDGMDGADGAQGPVGPQGAQGLQGPPGSLGAPLNWLGELASPPATPQAGDVYRNTTDGRSYFYDGNAWAILAADGAQGAMGVQGNPGPAGPALNWLGTLSSDPPSPSTNDAYYNATDGIAYVYSSGSFQTLARDGADGANGSDGAMGIQGIQGPVGPPGPQGATGASAPGGSGTPYGAEVSSFAGYSTATVNGAAGGRHAMHAICAAQFSNGHMCHGSEYLLANTATPTPAGGAWMDRSRNLASGDLQFSTTYGDPLGAREAVAAVNGNCNNWGSNQNTYTGAGLSPQGYVQLACDVAHAVACCDTPMRQRFAGFTTATTDGNIGERALAHFMCASEFAGSHMCHGSEYFMSNSSVAPPAQGAWMDRSRNPTSGMQEFSSAYGDPLGARDAFSAVNGNCDNWISNQNTHTGAAIAPSGYLQAACDVPRPVACCFRD